MKNKSVTYILIAVVVIIWGGIFFQIFSSWFSSGNSVENRMNKLVAAEAPDNYEISETFTIKANYRDPFLGKATVHRENDNAIQNPRPKKAPVSLPPVDWSFIKFLGSIRKPDVDKRIGLISVHGQEFMISEGEIIADIKCLRNFKDSIRISYQGRVTCIKK